MNGLLPTPNGNGENGKAAADVVDLTLDSSSSEEEEEEDEEEDDDDEGPQPKRRCSYEKHPSGEGAQLQPAVPHPGAG